MTPRRSASLNQFRSIQQEERDLVRDIVYEHPDELVTRVKWGLLSPNAKTSVSLDFPIGHTCAPTPLCAEVCYASRKGTPARWPKSLRKRLRNFRYVQESSTEEATNRLCSDFWRAQNHWRGRGVELDWLRVNGTGDLFPALVPVLNAFMARNPRVRLWVVTRQFALAALLDHAPNLYLQLSLDATTHPVDRRVAEELVAFNERAYCSFLRTKPDDDTRGAAIVFNAKRVEGLPYRSRTDCPADANRLELDNVRGLGGTACARCRKCFNEGTLARQRAVACP